MHFLEEFCLKTVRYNTINKFIYDKSKKLPILKKISLNFGYSTNEIKYLSSSLLAIELITKQKGVLTRIKKSNIMLKIRKGNPVGCKITLRRHVMYALFDKLLTDIVPKIKTGYPLNNSRINTESFTWVIKTTYNFKELEESYNLFDTTSNPTVTFVTNSKTEDKTFILKSFKLPVTTCKRNSIGRV